MIGAVDISIVIGYFIVLIIIGVMFRKKTRNVTEYFLAGRRLTLPIFVATLVSTWYGGLLGVGELSFNYGIVNWLTQGFFWYLSYLFFAFFLAKRVRDLKLFTIPDIFDKYYGKSARLVSAIFNFIMVTPAPYILSLGLIMNLFFDIPIWASIVLVTLIMIVYTSRGGFKGVLITDFIQFLFMMIGVSLVIPFSILKYGGFDFLKANLPAAHLTLTGTWTTQMILVWGFIAFWTLVDPGFYQRCFAAKDSKVPKKGILISILFWAMFDVCTTFIGLYARAAMPNLDPTTSFVTYSLSVLPAVLTGLFITGVIATIMSTVDSFTLLGAMNISHDIFKGIIKRDATQRQVINVTKVGIILSALLSVILALSFSSIVNMWYTIGTVGISAMLVPILFAFFRKKTSPISALYSMLLGAGVSIFWLVNGQLNAVDGWPVYILGLEPLYPGLFISLITIIMVRKWT